MALLGTPTPGRAKSRPGTCWRAWLAALLLAGLAGTAAGAPVDSREYQIKAVFLFNFAQFVEWPPAALGPADEPLVIGVLGDDPFGRLLDETVQGEKIDNRLILIRRFHRLEEVDHCHILFVSRSESAGLERIFAALRDRNILTVGESDQFANRGGMIGFMTEKNRIRLRINLDSATAGGLKISSKLLRPAEIVGQPRD